jgi:peptidoglycan/xylan/chitin deacetylase (PgdA/CDA1 family)
MTEQYYRRSSKTNKKSGFRIFLFLILLLGLAGLALFSFTQYLALQSLRSEVGRLEEQLQNIEDENRMLWDQYDQVVEENEKLREENFMLRSSTVISHGSRNTNLVAITIDDGAGPELIGKTLRILRENDVKATFFPMGSWVDLHPEVWKEAVDDGHELGNHTYSHAFLTTVSDERVKEELNRWQEAVDNALGFKYQTYFFRPPGMDGFTSPQGSTAKRYKEIIANKGMFAVLWDVELVYALRNEAYTTARVTEHVLANAKGGSIVLLHFTENDITALPDIINGLRRRGLEPCSLSELLLAEMQT